MAKSFWSCKFFKLPDFCSAVLAAGIHPSTFFLKSNPHYVFTDTYIIIVHIFKIIMSLPDSSVEKHFPARHSKF